jgi:predicted ATPase
MRLRYVHLENYPPIKDMAVRFASGSPLNRKCAIRFVVGVNGSGKSNLLRAVAEVFLALADERLPPFPVSLVYELGQRDTSGHHTFVIDCPGSKSKASIWVSDGFYWPDAADADDFSDFIEFIRTNPDSAPDGFSAYIKQGAWPQSAGIAMPKAVLAYTTGDLKPWSTIWNRNQDADGVNTETDEAEENTIDERPAGWTTAQEAAYQTMKSSNKNENGNLSDKSESLLKTSLFRRPILLDHTLLKCALFAVALPQAFTAISQNGDNIESTDSSLQHLLERGGWHHLVSVGFRCHMQLNSWSRTLRETAHDWFLSAGEVIRLPHPTETHRVLYFDLKGRFSGQSATPLITDKSLTLCSTQGEALLELLGGKEATAFERFTILANLRNTGLFQDIELRLRSLNRSESMQDSDAAAIDVGVLRYEELSDGEQMVLGRMALFHLLKGQENALLLLDEPETHFNDKWKREIIDIIDDAIKDTANDVLISTHSAIVLSDVFNDEIVMVVKNTDGSEARSVDEQTFATDPSAIMMTVFGADDSIGKRAQEYIEELLQKASGSTEDIGQLKALVKRMGSGFYRSELRTLLGRWEKNA